MTSRVAVVTGGSRGIGRAIATALGRDGWSVAVGFRTGEGDAAATRQYDEHRLAEVGGGGGEHRPSMGQDMVKGRRTEIEFLNGMVAKKGDEIGIATPANVVLTDIVKRVERGDLKPDPKHITDLRLN